LSAVLRRTEAALQAMPVLAPAIASACGLALAFVLFPAGLLLSQASWWDHVQGDNAQALIGYLNFAHDSWHWPIFKTVLLSPPEGVNIVFTDPIPLLALLGKITYKLTGWLPLYFGPWLLLAYVLQPVCGYFLLRKIRMSKTAALVGGLLFLLLPTFIFRYGHFPLLGHWLIIVALLIYLSIVDGDGPLYVAIGALFTTMLVLINPYLLAMVATIYFAALTDGFFRGNVTLRSAFVGAGVTIGSVIAVAVFLGFVGLDLSAPAGGGFGYYSMNLLSPVWPQLSAWPQSSTFILDSTGGQYEGFNYLGTGILLLMFMVVVAAPVRFAHLIGQYRFLFAGALVLAVYAVCPNIYLGRYLVGHVPFELFGPLAKFSEIFRSSGRFFWPLAYVLLLLSAGACYVRFGQRRFVAMALLLLIVQLVDIRPLFSFVSANATPAAHVIDHDKWKRALAGHDELLILPQFLCTAQSNRKYIYELELLAASLNIPTNAAIVNRSDIDCVAERFAFGMNLAAHATRSNPLILVFKSDVAANPLESARRRAGVECVDASFAYLCSGTFSNGLFELGARLGEPPVAKLGERLGTGQGQSGLAFLGYGWWPFEPGERFTWGVGPAALLAVKMAEPVCGEAALRARVLPYSAGAHEVTKTTIVVNGDAPIPYSLPGRSETDIEVPIHQQGCTDRFEVVFNFSGLKSPKQLGASTDPRPLSWALNSFSFDKAR
jgi:hypothetical protein